VCAARKQPVQAVIAKPEKQPIRFAGPYVAEWWFGNLGIPLGVDLNESNGEGIGITSKARLAAIFVGDEDGTFRSDPHHFPHISSTLEKHNWGPLGG
jgi:hypothetical protein